MNNPKHDRNHDDHERDHDAAQRSGAGTYASIAAARRAASGLWKSPSGHT